jgi:cation:H+ antiporter
VRDNDSSRGGGCCGSVPRGGGALALLVLLAIAGLVLLTVAADQLVLGAGRVARRLGVSAVVVGVVVIGLGTSAPEFVVSALAAAGGHPDLAAANLVGSNIINVTLVLGAAALLAPVMVRSTVPRQEAPLAAVAVALFAVAARAGLGRAAGLVLLLALVLALVMLVRLAAVGRGDPLPAEVGDYLDNPEPGIGPVRRLRAEVTRTVLGLAGTLVGAQILVTNAAAAAARLGVPPAVVGFTVVAFGTSLPELVTAIQAQRRRDTDLLVGNLLGSNLFNSLAGGALVGLATTGTPARLPYAVLAAMVAVTLLTWLVLFRGYRVSRPEAALLLVAYVLTLPLID